MKKMVLFSAASLLAALSIITACLQTKNDTPKVLLNVSYDVIRDFYKEYNPVFRREYAPDVMISQSHGGASKQVLSVLNGLPADVVTLTQSNDIDALVQKGLVKASWQTDLPNQATPFGSVMVFLVRKGNPKHIRDWADLTRADVKVVFANPKTSANGRFAYLSALAYAQKHSQNPEDFMLRLLRNVPVLEAGARGASISFTQRNMGDVLITPENEAALAAKTLGKDQFDLVYPSISAYTPVLVAEVSANTKHNGTQLLAKTYLRHLWSPQGQEIAAQNYFRPRDEETAEKYTALFPSVNSFDVNQQFGDWQQINQQHFVDNALFDRLYIAAQNGAKNTNKE
ncbi:sulfate ABC transporter substrate-binding protein [Aggregatibacter kilianii]|uniref:sulfate ABC transporter substrate-binding protein n=1 Tax=Aggregatibacter kilianii TaxID=2025884 RepID=UPI000D657FF8|nr:sulfate ABC transporter substrate-binding protein [Aggregatibacter kilianii]